MKTTTKRALLLSILALASVGSAFATTSYSQAVSSVSSVSIAGSTHGLGCPTFGVSFTDGSNVSRNDLISGWTPPNSSTYDTTISFTTTVIGTVYLTGCFPAYTTASTDFETILDRGQVYVCAVCTVSAPAVRNYLDSSSAYRNIIMLSPVIFYSVGTNADTVYVWLDLGTHRMVVGAADPSVLRLTAGNGVTFVTATAFPTSNVKPLAHVVWGGGTGWLFVNDDR